MSTKHGPVHVTPSYTVRVRGEHGCSVLSRPELVRDQVECYLNSRPHGIVDVYYSEHCARCSGSGRVLKSRSTLSWGVCPACKGEPNRVLNILIA